MCSHLHCKNFTVHAKAKNIYIFPNQHMSVINWYLLIREKLGYLQWHRRNLFLFDLLRDYDQIILFEIIYLLVTFSDNYYYFYFNSMWKSSYRVNRKHSKSWPSKYLPPWCQLYLARNSPTWSPDSSEIQGISSGVSLQLHKGLSRSLWHWFSDISWEVRWFCFSIFNTKTSCFLALLLQWWI